MLDCRQPLVATRTCDHLLAIQNQNQAHPQTIVQSGQGSLQARASKRKRKAYASPANTRLPAAYRSEPVPSTPLKLATPTICPKCNASKFEFEAKHFCCNDGNVLLASNDYPPELIRLFTSQEEDAVHFQKYSRLYNNLFAFSSIGGKIDASTQKGIYVFKLHGQIYHHVPDLLPTDADPKYLQLYFYDGQHEAENRLGCFPELRKDVVDILMSITEKNPYARFFRSLKELDIKETTQIVLNKNTSSDQRVYNAPTSDEVAVIWSESSGTSATDGPHVVVSGKSSISHRIKHYYGCYDPLQYPLLFPAGECGWHQGLKKASAISTVQVHRQEPDVIPEHAQTAESLLANEAQCALQSGRKGDKNVSCREYYSYKLQRRPGNVMLRAGRCFQQYVVDMYVKVENTRLDYFRNNQETIRADLYQGLLDSIDAGENCAANVGRRVILPPSFIGGPRDMKKRYLNAMALVQRYGKPDLFITMTCNTNWAEIKQELAKGELAQNRPDLVSRVFRAKLLALKKQIMEKHVFGKVAAMVYVVEFQKRGLPHAHLLIILTPEFKIRFPEDFDMYVCAEMLPTSNVTLRSKVLKHMMHGPCGHLNPECQCMKHKQSKGKCKYKYPKQFSNMTTNNVDGYPTYQRRDLGEQAVVRKVVLNNQWVIPYNPYLLALFDCHINVEVCSTIQAVKYMYKYVYKGHDRISFNLQQNGERPSIDEIDQFQSGRWVSPCEAAWRLFGFELFEMHPPVMPLPVHLPNKQVIQVRPHEELDEVVGCEHRRRTPLTEFFKVSSTIKGAGYLYGQFTEHYRWDNTKKTWFKRKNKLIMIGRPAFVAPAEGERYYLRLLLLHVCRPTSFDNLKTVDGSLCGSFQDAALKLHLLEEDGAVDMCLAEACEVQMPFALRRLFSTILIFCQPSEPLMLWSKYYAALSNDFRHQYPDQPNTVQHLTAQAVEQCLEAMGKTLTEFGLDHLLEPEEPELRRTRDIIDALDAPIPLEAIKSRSMLNEAQQEAFNTITHHVKEGIPGAFFVDGPGGTGKTFLYNALYAEVRLMNKFFLPKATSGIAAANLPPGRTTHSRMKIPLDISASLSCDVPKQSSLAALIRETSLIIWDEASMARRENVESVDALLRDLCDPSILFGGKVIVFGGDFRQVLPVVPRKSQREAVEASLVSSVLWPQLKKFRLTENIRARDDPEFSAFLLALGNGELQTKDNDLVQLPPGIIRCDDSTENPIKEITTIAFPELDMNNVNSDIFTTRVILTPMNEDVDTINSTLIGKFPGGVVMYRSFDTILDDNCAIYPSEFINTLCPGGMSPHELVLKENCPVILLRNVLPAYGLCNGTRLICKRFFPNLIECVITTGRHKGEHVFIPRINLRPSASSNYPFQFQRKQFPLKLSFAMTVNKAQGQTLSQVAIYLPRPCFSHGQLYVALSRARMARQVSIWSTSEKSRETGKGIKNVLSYDVLKLAGII